MHFIKNIQYLKTDFQNKKHSTENISLKLKTETQWIFVCGETAS